VLWAIVFVLWDVVFVLGIVTAVDVGIPKRGPVAIEVLEYVPLPDMNL
jgi:hypothetical protein